jgi:glutamine cyclotransferase
VLGWVDVRALLAPAAEASVEERGGVANGIAYDSSSNRVLITGKLWPRLFEVDARTVLGDHRRPE